jgi:subtilisin-like proprotein convertase family protein
MGRMLSRLMSFKGLSRRWKTQHSSSVFEPLESRLLLDANPLLPSSDVPKAIPDQQTIVSTLTVSGQASSLLDVEVKVNITHTWDSDLDVYLISPSGTRVELFTDVGGADDNFTDTILDDQASAGIASGTAPYTGSYRPEGSLSALVGQNPNGIWRLEITDDAGGDVGTLNSWAIRITTAAAAPEVEVRGNGVLIADGDTTPSTGDHTDFGTIVQAGPLHGDRGSVQQSGARRLGYVHGAARQCHGGDQER